LRNEPINKVAAAGFNKPAMSFIHNTII